MKDLIQRCYDWVEKNVPLHTRAEYEMLLRYNERLAVALISKSMAYDELIKAHHKLEKEVWDTTPTAPWVGNMSIDQDQVTMTRHFTIDWSVDRMLQRVTIPEREIVMNRYAAHREAVEALRSYFMREVAPKLFDRAVNSARAWL